MCRRKETAITPLEDACVEEGIRGQQPASEENAAKLARDWSD
jgi:hypothetical protein